MSTKDLSTTSLRLNSSTPVKRRLFGCMGNERGASMLEMAFIVTIMLSLVVGAVDLGFAYQHYGVVLNSSRESARLYSRLPCTGSNRTALRNAIISAAVAESNGGEGQGGISGGGGSIVVLGQNVKLARPNGQRVSCGRGSHQCQGERVVRVAIWGTDWAGRYPH
ncbi:MAG: pilus assembly protein [Anaerolineales bacterium]|nr:pilus assembly protein [Anaerolineales bacterium]